MLLLDLAAAEPRLWDGNSKLWNPTELCTNKRILDSCSTLSNSLVSFFCLFIFNSANHLTRSLSLRISLLILSSFPFCFLRFFFLKKKRNINFECFSSAAFHFVQFSWKLNGPLLLLQGRTRRYSFPFLLLHLLPHKLKLVNWRSSSVVHTMDEDNNNSTVIHRSTTTTTSGRSVGCILLLFCCV